MTHLPTRLARRMAHVLRAMQLRPEDIKAVRSAIERNEVPDYPSDANAFAYLYFGANFAKAYRAIEALAQRGALPDRVRLLDLGCGHGASTAGALAALHDQGGRVERVLAIDQSPTQLAHFDAGVKKWIRSEFSRMRVDRAQASVWEFSSFPGEWNLLLASYLLCEMEDRAAFTTYLRDHTLVSRAKLVMIDSDESGSPIWTCDGVTTPFDRPSLYLDLSCLKQEQLEMPKYGRTAA